MRSYYCHLLKVYINILTNSCKSYVNTKGGNIRPFNDMISYQKKLESILLTL